MAICPKCGKFIGDDLYCKSCGANRFARPERAKETGQSTQHRPLKTDGWTGEPKSSNSGTAVALFLAVVLLSLGGIGILMISEGNTSHIAVYVYSTESMEVDVEISIDGESKALYEGVIFGYNYYYTASYYENI
ncbi:MAG: hypothetical protein LBE48_03315 [Methanomassiliicoccaceae archaeon]|jgi:hypothetical protein|nr:hypothetical protein [Methanomassiliicoccaceae archaeon]